MALAKILFIAPGEEDDDLESLWAEEQGDGQYVLQNAPAFVKDVAWGDVVRAEEHHGNLWFKEVVRRSGHGAVWVAVGQRDDVKNVLQACKDRGANVESVDDIFLTLDVPPGQAMAGLIKILDEFDRDGVASYQIGCPSDPVRTDS